MVVIYSIKSPTGKLYFGQSTNYKHRIATHKNAKDKSKLYNSIKKYGFEAHIFTMLHEFPDDVDKKILTTYEQFYIDQHREAGIEILNVKDAGDSGSPSQEVKDKIRASLIGHKPSDSTRALWSLQRKGKGIGAKRSDETRKRIREALIGKKRKPRGPMPEETRRKISAANMGKTHRKGAKLSDEYKAKITGRPKK